MKIRFILYAFTLLIPAIGMAQDDMYFTPSKQTKEMKAMKAKKQNEERARREAIANAENQEEAYYSGISKSTDEYNRRRHYAKKGRSVTTESSDVILGDSIAEDIITFNAATYTDTISMVASKMAESDDYLYASRLQRFDVCYYDPWFYDRFWWGRRYGSMFYYSAWYDPWFDPWFDPWYDPFYSPWAYRYRWYDPWFYGPGFIHRPIVAYIPRYSYTTHQGVRRGGVAGRMMDRNSSASYRVAQRNGANVVNEARGRQARSLFGNTPGNYRGRSTYESSRSNFGGSNYARPSSSGFSGGGFSGGARSGGVRGGAGRR